MTFSNAVELWEYQHGAGKFMDDFVINAAVEKPTLLDYLLYDYGTMRIVETNSDAFHDMVDNFFKVHKWNIDKLAESLSFEYNPLDNTDWRQVQDFDRGEDFDSITDRDVVVDRDMGVDQKTVVDRDVDVDEKEIVDRDIKVNRDENIDRRETIDTDKTWSERGQSDEEDRHFVSAYNDDNRDTPRSRDTIHQSYDKSGNEHTNTVDTEHTTDLENTITADDIVTTTTKNTDEDVVTTERTDTAEDIGTAEDIVKNEQTKEQIDVIITKKGHDGNVSYQSLIEEERKQAQFNLYKWIGNHFARELLICLW